MTQADESPAGLAPDLDLFLRLAQAALAGLPDPWRDSAAAVMVQVADFPWPDLLDELDIEDPFELTGVYDGIPLTQKSISDQPIGPDTIWLFRRPILDEWIARGNVTLADLITHVLVHELAHHFGWSDDDIAAVDRWWE